MRNLFLCLDCILRFVAVEIKKRESEEKREREEREKSNFLFNQVIFEERIFLEELQ